MPLMENILVVCPRISVVFSCRVTRMMASFYLFIFFGHFAVLGYDFARAFL